MANVLSDGSVLPHDARIGQSTNRLTSKRFDDLTLHLGEVTRQILPGDPDNQYGETEYEVLVDYQKGNNASVSMPYHCRLATGLGSPADLFRYKLRRRESGSEKKEQGLGNGTRVVILCLDGMSNRGIILGAVSHEQSETQFEGEGRALLYRFNGVQVEINDDGELKCTVPGATKNDGLPDEEHRVESNKETYIRFTKEGNILVTNQSGESIEIDTTNRAIHVKAKDKDTETENDWDLIVHGNMTTKVDNNMNMVAEGNAQFSGKDQTYIGSMGSNEPMVLGTALANALRDLVQIFEINQQYFGHGLVPVRIIPPVMAMFQQWKAKHLTADGTPLFCSKDKFSEREST